MHDRVGMCILWTATADKYAGLCTYVITPVIPHNSDYVFHMLIWGSPRDTYKDRKGEDTPIPVLVATYVATLPVVTSLLSLGAGGWPAT